MANIWLDQTLSETLSINVESFLCLKIGFFICLFVFSLHVNESSYAGFFSVFRKHTKKSINCSKTNGVK